MSGATVHCNLCFPKVSIVCEDAKITREKHLQHLRMVHLGEYKPYTCCKCEETFSTERSLNRHASLRHGQKELKSRSSNCSLYLNTLGRLMQQYNTFIWKNHKESAAQMINFVKQTERKQNPTESSSESRKQEKLSTIYRRRNLRHRNDENEIACIICGSKFESIGAWRLHQDENHSRVSKAPYECLECHKRYFHHFLLQTCHKSMRTAPKELKCEFCEMKFGAVGGLLLHQDRRHDSLSNGPLKCDKCDRRFHYPAEFRMHNKNSHVTTANKKEKMVFGSGTGNKNNAQLSPLKCRVCMKDFATRSDLVYHQILLEHRKKRQSAMTHWNYCLECERSFSITPKEHLAVFHIKKQVVECSKCNYKHRRVSMVAAHIRKIHRGNAKIIDRRAATAREFTLLERKIIMPFK